MHICNNAKSYESSITDQDLLNPLTRSVRLNAKPRFSHGDATYQKFKTHYESDGWIGRKIVAIPSFIACATLKPVYHVATAILLGTPKAVFGNSRYFKVQVFKIGRDFQQAFGCFATIFNDRCGQYHLQSSVFHKKCYDDSLEILKDQAKIIRVEGDLASGNVGLHTLRTLTQIRANLSEKKKLYEKLFNQHSYNVPESVLYAAHTLYVGSGFGSLEEGLKITKRAMNRLQEREMALKVLYMYTTGRTECILYPSIFSLSDRDCLDEMDHIAAALPEGHPQKEELTKVLLTLRWTLLGSENVISVLRGLNVSEDKCIEMIHQMLIDAPLDVPGADKLLSELASLSIKRNIKARSAESAAKLENPAILAEVESLGLTVGDHVFHRVDWRQNPTFSVTDYLNRDDVKRAIGAILAGRRNPLGNAVSLENNPALAYQLLELNLGATNEQVREAHRALARRYHPDRCHKNAEETEEDFAMRREESSARFTDIQAAYERLNMNRLESA